MITVLIADDNPSVRVTLRHLIEAEGDLSVVAEAGDGQVALATAIRLRPRVTLLDYRMPVADGLSVVEQVAACSNVLVLTGSPELDLIAPMLALGARGYLVYGQFDPAELPRAIRAVAAGQGWLTPAAASVAAAAMRESYARQRADHARVGAEQAARRRFGLTDREEEVLGLVSAGLTNAAVAARLEISEKTVKNHLNAVFGKLHVRTRTEAVIRWRG
jgi:DNA-binding NarL/FixJ family response regulator